VRRLDPRTVDLTFATNPSGLGLTIGGTEPAASPITRTFIVGSTNSISAPSPQSLNGGWYAFSGWSDGGAQAHQITAPASATTYSATFGSTPPPTCADTLPAVTATGWQRNGTATVSGTGVQLTPPTSFSAGTVIYTTPLPSAGLRVCFDAEIGGGTGADGMTLMLLNPSAGAGALGDDGSGLGYGTLPGLAVALDTFDSGTADPSGNFVGIANGGNARGLTWLSTSTAIPTLENAGPVPVEVQVVSGRLQVKVAGSQVLDTAVSLPSQVLLGFSAGTGGQADRHIVRNVRVGGATASDPPFLTVSPSSVAFV